MQNFSKEKTYALFATPFNKKIIADLKSQNIETVIFPTFTTSEIEDEQSVLQNLFEFDWLIFPDVYAAEYFVQVLENKGVDLFELDELRVLAFGEAVADRLRFSQLHADIIPSTIKTSDVLQSLKDYIFDESEFSELRFLVIKEQNAKIEIIGELPNVTELAIYSANLSDETQIPKLKALLKGGAIDEFIFSSPVDVINLAHIFQIDNLEEVLSETKLTATDKQTSQTLEEFRLL